MMTNFRPNQGIDFLRVGRDQELVNKFPKYAGELDSFSTRDFLGTRSLHKYVPDYSIERLHYPNSRPNLRRLLRLRQGKIPHEIPRNEEYFEWLDLLESVLSANYGFTFIEVGAGFGRWAARAYKAAELAGIPFGQIRICTIEPEPRHSIWLREHMKLNKIPFSSLCHHECAVSNYEGTAEFFVGRPKSDLDLSLEAKNWYGQALKYSGWEGAQTIQVPVRRLSSILDSIKVDQIDLINFDIQGEEPRALQDIRSHIQRIKRIHIGTMSRSDESFFREYFDDLGWIKIRDYEGQGTRNTYIGKISFVDGVQTWLNPLHL
jgi:FkbM family methyltransferase